MSKTKSSNYNFCSLSSNPPNIIPANIFGNTISWSPSWQCGSPSNRQTENIHTDRYRTSDTSGSLRVLEVCTRGCSWGQVWRDGDDASQCLCPSDRWSPPQQISHPVQQIQPCVFARVEKVWGREREREREREWEREWHVMNTLV